MESQGLDDDWDDPDFLNEIEQAEKHALLATQRHPPIPPEPPRPSISDVSYSPPRELSQRVVEAPPARVMGDCFDSLAPRETYLAKQQDIDRLKEELNRVSKQRDDLERECSELKRARVQQEEQVKVTHSRVEAKNAELRLRKTIESDSFMAPGIPAVHEYDNSSNNKGQNVEGRNTMAVCANTAEASTSAAHNDYCGSEKLINMWSSNDQKLGRVLVAKLFRTCEADFQVLFGYLNSPRNDSVKGLSNKASPTHPTESTKVSHLYSVLTMISYDSLRLEDLLEALVDLCALKDGVIVHRSLRVLHAVLCNSFHMENEFGRRGNVLLEEPFPENAKTDIRGGGNSEDKNFYFENLVQTLKEGEIPGGLKFSSVKIPGHSMLSYHRFGMSINIAYWVSLFERMCRICTDNNIEQIRHEALLVMNLILMRQNAYSERDKFAGELVFQSVSKLLGRDAGFTVQDQAVHTLYLLCNCPKVIAMLSGFNEGEDPLSSKGGGEKNGSTFSELNNILTGLADCVVCYKSSTAEEMKLRRNTIVFLAFLGSSGKSGFNILINYQLPKDTNFLQIILESLVSDLDLLASKSTNRSGFIREQWWLLIRETLIFLNRLVSHPQYSVLVLQALTNTRGMTSMTVDVAHRLTQKSKLLWHDNSTTKQFRGSEIVDLGWVFKKRVLKFLEEIKS